MSHHVVGEEVYLPFVTHVDDELDSDDIGKDGSPSLGMCIMQ